MNNGASNTLLNFSANPTTRSRSVCPMAHTRTGDYARHIRKIQARYCRASWSHQLGHPDGRCNCCCAPPKGGQHGCSWSGCKATGSDEGHHHGWRYQNSVCQLGSRDQCQHHHEALDETFGAGQLNVYNSYKILEGGEFDGNLTNARVGSSLFAVGITVKPSLQAIK